jgi:hypothetical protein
MTREETFIGQLEGYLEEYEGMTPLPDPIRDAVRAQLPTTRQIGPIAGLMRDFNMSATFSAPVRYGLAAAVVIAVIVGGALFYRPDSGGPPDATATPGPTATPAADFSTLEGGGTSVPPGDYLFTSLSPLRITATIPAGWYKGVVESAVWAESNAVTVAFMTLSNLYVDPCLTSPVPRDPAVGPTAADLAVALGDVPQVQVTEPLDVTLGGFTGKQLDLTAPNIWDGCDAAEALIWELSGGDEPLTLGGGNTVQLWILDVNETRLVIAIRQTGPATTELAQAQAIVDSIRIE